MKIWRRTSKNKKLITEKYQEEYIRDLIEPSKTFLKTYLLPYLNEEYFETYRNWSLQSQGGDLSKFEIPVSHSQVEVIDHDKLNIMSQWMSENMYKADISSEVPEIRRTSKRILEKNYKSEVFSQTFGAITEKSDFAVPKKRFFTAAFLNNEWFDFQTKSKEDVAVGNSADEVIETTWREIGFNPIFINFMTVKRSFLNLSKNYCDGTKYYQIDAYKQNNDSSKKRSMRRVYILQDVDTVLPDEVGFYNGVLKIMDGAQIPIILTSHKSFKQSEVVKRAEKKKINIKNIEITKSEISALKIKIRLHIIILFECIIGKYINDFMQGNDVAEDSSENLLDLDKIPNWDQDLHIEEISSQYKYITRLLRHMDFNFKKALCFIRTNPWKSLMESIDLGKKPANWIPNREDWLFNRILFETSNPKFMITQEMFDKVLEEIELSFNTRKEDWATSTEESSKGEQNSPGNEKMLDDGTALEEYTKYIKNMSEFTALQCKQMNFQEDMGTKNICDVDISSIEGISKDGCSEVVNDFWFGIPSYNRNKVKKLHDVKHIKGTNSEKYGRYLIKTTNQSYPPTMTMPLKDGQDWKIPYSWFITKEGNLGEYKRKFNATYSLYGLLEESRTFNNFNNKLLYSKIGRFSESK
jgi:hypothetical protein